MKLSNTPLKTGSKAPNFSLKTTPDQEVSLSDFKGKKNVILMFYPADFSPVCGEEVTLFNEILPEFKKHNAQLLGVSVDSVWCHLAFAKEKNLHFPLLSDFHPKGGISKKYNSYDEDEGESKRTLYVINKNGEIVWGYTSPTGINPGADGVLNALENVNH